MLNKYLIIIILLFTTAGCIESKKAGDIDRENIDMLADFNRRFHPSPETEAFKAKTQYNKENPPKLVDGKAIVDGIKKGVEVFAPAIGSIFGIPPVVYMPIVGTILAGAKVLIDKNKTIAETKQASEINKLLPVESHEAYAEAKATVIANGGVAVPIAPPPKV